MRRFTTKRFSGILKWLFFISLCYIPYQVRAQLSDSLNMDIYKQIGKNYQGKKLEIDDLINIIRIANVDFARKHHDELLKLVKKLELSLPNIQSTAQNTRANAALGAAYMLHGQYDYSSQFFKNALKSNEQMPETEAEHVESYLCLCDLSMVESKLDSALFYLEMAKSTFKQNNLGLEIKMLGSYSIIYDLLKETRKSLDCEFKIRNLLSFEGPWSSNYTASSVKIAALYISLFKENKQPQYLDSSRIFLQNIMFHKKQDSVNWYGICYFLLGKGYFLNKEYNKAYSIIKSSLLPEFIENNAYDPNTPSIAKLYLRMSEAYLGLISADELNAYEITPYSYRMDELKQFALYEIYKNKKVDLALKHYQEYIKNRDSIAYGDNQIKVAINEQMQNLKNREIKINQLENEKLKASKQNLYLLGGSVILIIVAILIITLLNFRRKQQIAKSNSVVQNLSNKMLQMELEINKESLEHAKTIQQVISEQRKSFSMLIHDDISSSIAALKYYIVDKSRNVEEKSKTQWKHLVEEVESIYQNVRSIMHNLNAVELTGNEHMLESLIERLTTVYSSETFKIICLKPTTNITNFLTAIQNQELTFILKEAVANAIKHSKADLFTINFYREEDDIIFELKDNGLGYKNLSNKEGHYGIANMKHRLEQLGGQLKIKSDTKQTVFIASLPIEKAK